MPVDEHLFGFAFEPPCKLLSMNDRMHWRPKAVLVDRWRTATKWAAAAEFGKCNRGGRVLRRPLPPGIVRIALPVRTQAQRDPHNYFATVKPMVDGLVDAMLWPDDTPEFVTVVEPRLVLYPRGMRPAVTVLIDQR